MHNRKIDLGNGRLATVAIAADIRKNLGVFAFSEVVKDYGRGKITGAFWLFETGLAIKDYCDPNIAPLDRSAFVGDFELSPTGRFLALTV